jgi:hypothetical protein
MLSLAGSAMAAVTTTNVGKDRGTPYVNPVGERQGGDTFGTATVIPALPYSDSGTTLGYVNDYDAVCPYSGSTAPDVVYVLTPATTEAINIDLCYSSYDTKLYVYDSLDLVNPIACNDDYYFAAPCYTYSSFLGEVGVTAGHTYYIVVDGYGGFAGAYVLDVINCADLPPTGACCAPSGACTVTTQTACTGVWQGENTVCIPNPCPTPGHHCDISWPYLEEGEPACGDNYVDNYNGGCNSTPVIWQTLLPLEGDCARVCGLSCTYLSGGGSNRDTDWYLAVGCGGTVTYTMTADFPFMQALVTGVDCAGLVYSYNLGNPYESWTLTADVASAVDVGFFAANSFFSGYPLESYYYLNVCGICEPPPPPGACCNAAGMCIVTTPELCAFTGGQFIGGSCTPNPCSTPTERKSWGAVKNLYRDVTR